MKKIWFYIFVGVVVLLGIFLRTEHFLVARPLWHDETSLALSIISRSYFGLFFPLEHYQSAPPFFMCLSKLMYDFLKSPELALRIVPFLCSIGLL